MSLGEDLHFDGSHYAEPPDAAPVLLWHAFILLMYPSAWFLETEPGF